METITELQYGQYESVEQDDYSSRLFFDLHNSRLKLNQYQGNVDKVIKNTIDLCGKYGIGKILATVRETDRQAFFDHGFVQEAVIAGYFQGETGYNVSFFYDQARAFSARIKEEDEIIAKAEEYWGQFSPLENSEFIFRTGSREDAPDMAYLYDTVFKTYPTPMDNENYISGVIQDDLVLFKVAEYDKRIVSAASAELNKEFFNAEITDCATFMEFRGKGLLSELVYHLENLLQEKKYVTLYSVARATSPGINIVFSKHGYEYTGRQINNSNIMGKLEDMNIWVKRLAVH